MKSERVQHPVGKTPTLPPALGHAGMARPKGVQHSKNMKLPPASADPIKGASSKGVKHAASMALPPRRHGFAEANGGMAGSLEGKINRDDKARSRGRTPPY